jgi:hypothetical protein
MELPQISLQSAARRYVAAAWFAASGALATVGLFLPLSKTGHFVLLYVALPAFSAGIAGYFWGGAILETSRINTYGGAALRGLAVSTGAYAIFSLLFACGLPLLEAGWSIRQAPSFLLFSLTFGVLLTGPVVLAVGMIAGSSLFALKRYFQ